MNSLIEAIYGILSVLTEDQRNETRKNVSHEMYETMVDLMKQIEERDFYKQTQLK